mmetsp:Transcript_857/g.1572  ORF Transcript_857/g.1572 Transcript_857/m.1572 type:complete len:108 (+) Transcript_857:2-325(+)
MLIMAYPGGAALCLAVLLMFGKKVPSVTAAQVRLQDAEVERGGVSEMSFQQADDSSEASSDSHPSRWAPWQRFRRGIRSKFRPFNSMELTPLGTIGDDTDAEADTQR